MTANGDHPGLVAVRAEDADVRRWRDACATSQLRSFTERSRLARSRRRRREALEVVVGGVAVVVVLAVLYVIAAAAFTPG